MVVLRNFVDTQLRGDHVAIVRGDHVAIVRGDHVAIIRGDHVAIIRGSDETIYVATWLPRNYHV